MRPHPPLNHPPLLYPLTIQPADWYAPFPRLPHKKLIIPIIPLTQTKPNKTSILLLQQHPHHHTINQYNHSPHGTPSHSFLFKNPLYPTIRPSYNIPSYTTHMSLETRDPSSCLHSPHLAINLENEEFCTKKMRWVGCMYVGMSFSSQLGFWMGIVDGEEYAGYCN